MSIRSKRLAALSASRLTGLQSLPLTGLTGRWEARHTLAMDSNPANGASVSSWTNLMTPGTQNWVAGTAPTYQAASPTAPPAIVFNGTNQYLTATFNITERTWYAVWSATEVANERILYHWASSNSTGCYIDNNTHGGIAIFQPTIYTSTGGSITPNTTYIDCVQMASGTMAAWRDNTTAIAPVAGTVPTTNTAAYLAVDVSLTLYAACKISAVLLYNSAHDATTRNQVYAYLRQQYT